MRNDSLQLLGRTAKWLSNCHRAMSNLAETNVDLGQERIDEAQSERRQCGHSRNSPRVREGNTYEGWPVTKRSFVTGRFLFMQIVCRIVALSCMCALARVCDRDCPENRALF